MSPQVGLAVLERWIHLPVFGFLQISVTNVLGGAAADFDSEIIPTNNILPAHNL
jgi:hypothetical protein